MDEVKPKSKGNLVIVLLIVLILLLSAALVYLVFFSGKDKDSTKKEETNTKQDIEEPRELNKSELSDLMSIIDKYYLRNLADHYKNKKFTSTLDNGMLELMYYYMQEQDNDSWSKHFENGKEWSFDISKADNYFKTLYGFKADEYKDLLCDLDKIPLLKYDKENNRYVFNDEHPGHGGRTVGYTDYYVTSSSKTNNRYEIAILFLYGNEMDGYYVNGEELNIDFDESYVEPDDFVKAYKDYFKENINEFKSVNKYVFTFEKVNNNYLLKEFNIEK